ncbi:MAG: glycosyltransferase family 4 protein [Sphingomonadales bacterium]
MRIALVVPGGVDRSGTHKVIPCLLWLIERLARAGNDVHVFALHQESHPGRWQLLGAQIHNAGTRPRRLRSLAQLYAEHRREHFDVVHGFWAAGPGLVAVSFGRIVGVPAVLTLPGGDLTALADIGYGGRLTWRGRVWTRLALAGATAVIVPSGWMAEKAAALSAHALRIPFGVALDRWPVRPPRRRRPGTLRLVHVANLSGIKDQETLLRAARSLRDRGLAFHLDIIGFDTLGGAVQRRCAELGLSDAVRFHGFMPHAEVRPWIENADILVVSSRHEAGPLVTLEAAVAGVPTVGTAVGHIADWAPEAAIAAPIGDFDALAGAIGHLAANEDERLRLAAAAQARAVSEDADFTAARTQRLYADLVDLRRTGRRGARAPSD